MDVYHWMMMMLLLLCKDCKCPQRGINNTIYFYSSLLVSLYETRVLNEVATLSGVSPSHFHYFQSHFEQELDTLLVLDGSR